MRIRKFILIIVFSALIWSCSKSERPVLPLTNALTEADFDLSQLDQLRVKELLVVIFERDFTAAEWKTLFDQTRKLSFNKRKLRQIEGQMEGDSDRLRGDLIGENAELLTELSQRSLFLMSWSAGDENCRFVGKDETRLRCKPRSLDNPLNGGLPTPLGIVKWIQPNPVQSETKASYLQVVLNHSDPAFKIELRLQPESFDPQELWFKGEAVPLEGSQFKSAAGANQTSFFRFGYTEMTLSP